MKKDSFAETKHARDLLLHSRTQHKGADTALGFETALLNEQTVCLPESHLADAKAVADDSFRRQECAGRDRSVIQQLQNES